MTEIKKLIIAVEGTAAMGPFWRTILSDYLEKIVRSFYGNEMAGQKLSAPIAEFSLVSFNTHGPYSPCGVRRSGWTRNVDTFLQWLSALPFSGGGFEDAAIAEGLSEALMMFPISPSGTLAQQTIECQRHCILVAASNPYPLPTPVYRPQLQNLEQGENIEAETESRLSDAETLAKSFAQCSVSLSVICPKQLPKLRAIYNAGKRNQRTPDAPIDSAKNPHFLVLMSENFMEARAALSRPGVTNLASNQSPVKMDMTSVNSVTGAPPTSIPSGNGSVMNRQPISGGNLATATVKVEPSTVTSMGSQPTFPQIPTVARPASQGFPSGLQTLSPSSASQDMITNGENVQEVKPIVSVMPQSLRPVQPAAANVSILNNLSQARVMNSAALTGGTSIGLPSMGQTPVAVHMSNMISSGMASSMPAAQTAFSSGQSAITSVTGTGALAATSQVSQNTGLGSLTPATSNMSANSNPGSSQPMGNLQGGISVGQSVPGMSQGNLSGGQIVQNGISVNQNMMGGLRPSGVSSGTGMMIPTPGMTQQGQPGTQPLGANNNLAVSMPLSQDSQQTSSALQSAQSKYIKVWEGNLSGQRQGQPVFITRLEGYRSYSAAENLAANWPPTMQIVRLISQDHMNNKQYVGKADFLVFRALNQHGFLAQLQEKKLCAVIQLPSQTLLLSVSDKAFRLIGMLFPGDMVVFKPQIPSQQQQLQQQMQSQQHPQLQQQQLQQLQQQQQQQQLSQLQQQQQQLTQMPQQLTQMPQQQQQPLHQLQQQQQLPQQQMVGTGIGQSYIQGAGRSQLVSQGQVSSQGPPNNVSGGGFMS